MHCYTNLLSYTSHKLQLSSGITYISTCVTGNWQFMCTDATSSSPL